MLTGNTRVRLASQGDWRAIKSLLEEGHLPLEGAREHLSEYFVALIDDIIVGCAGLERYGNIALLRSVAVAPLMKGKGIGKLLSDRLLQEAKQARIATLYLLTFTAEEYFAKRGFVCQPLESAPSLLRASAEFQGACPDSAVLMSLSISKMSD